MSWVVSPSFVGMYKARMRARYWIQGVPAHGGAGECSLSGLAWPVPSVTMGYKMRDFTEFPYRRLYAYVSGRDAEPIWLYNVWERIQPGPWDEWLVLDVLIEFNTRWIVDFLPWATGRPDLSGTSLDGRKFKLEAEPFATEGWDKPVRITVRMGPNVVAQWYCDWPSEVSPFLAPWALSAYAMYDPTDGWYKTDREWDVAGIAFASNLNDYAVGSWIKEFGGDPYNSPAVAKIENAEIGPPFGAYLRPGCALTFRGPSTYDPDTGEWIEWYQYYYGTELLFEKPAFSLTVQEHRIRRVDDKPILGTPEIRHRGNGSVYPNHTWQGRRHWYVYNTEIIEFAEDNPKPDIPLWREIANPQALGLQWDTTFNRGDTRIVSRFRLMQSPAFDITLPMEWEACQVETDIGSKVLATFNSLDGWTASGCTLALEGSAVKITCTAPGGWAKWTPLADHYWSGTAYLEVVASGDDCTLTINENKAWDIGSWPVTLDLLKPDNIPEDDYENGVLADTTQSWWQFARPLSDPPDGSPDGGWLWGVDQVEGLLISGLSVGESITLTQINRKHVADHKVLPESWPLSKTWLGLGNPPRLTAGIAGGKGHFVERILLVTLDGKVVSEPIGIKEVIDASPTETTYSLAQLDKDHSDYRLLVQPPAGNVQFETQAGAKNYMDLSHPAKLLCGENQLPPSGTVPAVLNVDAFELPNFGHHEIDYDKRVGGTIYGVVFLGGRRAQGQTIIFSEQWPVPDKSDPSWGSGRTHSVLTDSQGCYVSGWVDPLKDIYVSVDVGKGVNNPHYMIPANDLRSRWRYRLALAITPEGVGGLSSDQDESGRVWLASAAGAGVQIRLYEPRLESSRDYLYEHPNAGQTAIFCQHRRRKPSILLCFEDSGNIIQTESPTGMGDWSAETTITAGESPVLLDDPAARGLKLFYVRDGAIRWRRQTTDGWGDEQTALALTGATGLSVRASQVDSALLTVSSDGTDVVVSKSDDLGRTWSAWTTIAQGTYPHLLIERTTGLTRLVYQQDGQLYIRAGSVGAQFGDEIAVGGAQVSASPVTMRILSSRAAELALWYTAGDGALHLVRSANGGKTWI